MYISVNRFILVAKDIKKGFFLLSDTTEVFGKVRKHVIYFPSRGYSSSCFKV